MWLSVDGANPRTSAARRKLRCVATAERARSSLRVGWLFMVFGHQSMPDAVANLKQ